VTDFSEKPSIDLYINLGYMCLGRKAITLLKEGVDLAGTLRTLARDGDLAACSVLPQSEYVMCDDLAGLAEAHRFFGERPAL
jgi:hypothetical protein